MEPEKKKAARERLAKIKRILKSARKAVPIAVLAIAAVLVFLYAEEFYDFVFIDRPPTQSPVADETDITTDAPESKPDATEDTATPEVPDTGSAEAEPIIDPKQFYDADAAGAEGYYVTDTEWSDEMILSELRSRLEETDEYSLRTRSWNAPVYKYEYTNAPAELEWQVSEAALPALEAYMGYIFADTGDTVYVYDSLGRYVCDFNPNYYEFAYKRDRDGNPLFRRAYNYTVYNKEGDKYGIFKDFDYYVLSGGKISASGYNNAAENRGIMADYPGYFGVGESNIDRKCIYNSVVQLTVKGVMKSFVRTRWQLMWGSEPINDETYYAAFPYSEGLACVTDEEGIMYFVDTDGNKAFESKKDYFSTELRRVVEQYLLPLDETDAVGCLYYDRGLVMARRQTYDYYQLEDYDLMYIMEDKYVMLYRDGSLFAIPSGYNVKAYSSGVILLERNGKYGYMDYTGAWLGSPVYEDAKPFSEGLAACKKNGKWGLIDTNGNTVLPFIYDSLQSPSSGVIVCHSDSGWNTYLKMTK